MYQKTPALGSLFNTIAGLLACNFIKRRLQDSCFPVNIGKFLRTAFLQNISENGLYHHDVNNDYIAVYIIRRSCETFRILALGLIIVER